MDQPEEDWKTEPWSIPKVATGIEGLDEILHGGLPAGRMIIAAGGPGTAKTVFASEFVYRGAMAGSPGIFVSFEEEEAALRANARTFGWDFEKLEDAGRLRLMAVELPRGIVRAGEFDIQGLLTILSARVKALKADRIVLDAVDVFLNVYNEMDREREALGQLQDWLRRQDVTAVFTLKTLPEGKRLYPFLDFMADCVIYFDQRISDQVRTRRLSVVKYRGSGYMGNEHPFLVSRTGIRLLPVPAVTMSHRPLGEYISSGSTKFDEILGGGFRRASTVLIAGASGIGKTTLGCCFAQEACRLGDRVLYVNFEQSREAMVSEMLSPGIDLAPFQEANTLKIVSAMPESMGIEEHLGRILDTVDNFAPGHLVLDAISACRRMGSERAAFDFLVRLLNFSKQQGITCLLINQLSDNTNRSVEYSGFGISSLTDTVILLQYVEAAGTVRRRLLVAKSRGTAHSLKYHELTIGDGGIDLSEVSPVAPAPQPMGE